VDALADPTAIEPRTRALARLGRRLPSSAVPWARRVGEEFGAAMADFFDEIDVLLLPTMPVLPRAAGCLAERGVARTLALMLPCAAYTGPWNAAGLPAMNLPVATTSADLPVGVQIVGPALGEATLLGLAASVEAAAGWRDRRVASTVRYPRLP
jgi:amidase